MSEETTTGSVATDTGSSTDAPVQDWKASLSDDIRSDPSLADIKDADNLAKSYIHAQKMIGKNRVALPDENATDSDWGQFYDSLGRPASAKDYNFGDRPEMPAGVQYDENFENTYKELSHKAGLTPKQAKELYDGYNEYVNGQIMIQGEDAVQQSSKWVEEVKKEFGKAYDERVDLARRAVDTYGDAQLKEWLDSSGMGNNPMMLRMFSKMGEGLAEGKSDNSGQRSFTMTPEQAKQEIARYNRDSDFMTAYSSGDHQGHAAAVERMDSLFKLAYPDETPIQPA
jgi:hypothetical protein